MSNAHSTLRQALWRPADLRRWNTSPAPTCAPIMLAQNGGFGLVDILPVLGIALILISALTWWRKRRQQSAEQPTAREELHRIRENRAMRGDMEQLMVEIEQMAKRMGSQLDNKSLKLERLIREADARIHELQRIERLNASGRTSAHDQAEPSQTPPPDDAGWHTSEADPTFGGGSLEDELKRRVYELADAGHEPNEIARQLDEHIGKVELMLALRQQ